MPQSLFYGVLAFWNACFYFVSFFFLPPTLAIHVFPPRNHFPASDGFVQSLVSDGIRYLRASLPKRCVRYLHLDGSEDVVCEMHDERKRATNSVHISQYVYGCGVLECKRVFGLDADCKCRDGGAMTKWTSTPKEQKRTDLGVFFFCIRVRWLCEIMA